MLWPHGTPHDSLTLGLHIMETLPLDPRPQPMLRLYQSILPTELSHGFTSVVGTERTHPAIHPLKWLLMYSELCSQHYYLFQNIFSSRRRSLPCPHANQLSVCMDVCIQDPSCTWSLAFCTWLGAQGSRCITSGFIPFLWLSDAVLRGNSPGLQPRRRWLWVSRAPHPQPLSR